MRSRKNAKSWKKDMVNLKTSTTYITLRIVFLVPYFVWKQFIEASIQLLMMLQDFIHEAIVLPGHLAIMQRVVSRLDFASLIILLLLLKLLNKQEKEYASSIGTFTMVMVLRDNSMKMIRFYLFPSIDLINLLIIHIIKIWHHLILEKEKENISM